MVRRALTVLNHVLGKSFVVAANIASILGFLIIAVSQKNQALIALISLVIFLVAILIRLFVFFDRFLQLSNTLGHESLATYLYYKTDDGKIIHHQIYKHLVCKNTVMYEHTHNFNWTGPIPPIISSDTMDFLHVAKNTKNNQDQAIFKFRRPIFFKEFAIAHIRMFCDDTRQVSDTRVVGYVRETLPLLDFTIELGYKTGSVVKDAVLSKRPLNTHFEAPYEFVELVPFDRNNNSYKKTIHNPELGYAYKIEWER